MVKLDRTIVITVLLKLYFVTLAFDLSSFSSARTTSYNLAKIVLTGLSAAEGHNLAAVCEYLRIQRRNTSMDCSCDAVQCSTVFSSREKRV